MSSSAGSGPLTIACPASVVSSTPFDCTVTIVMGERTPEPGEVLQVRVPPGLFHLANTAGVRFNADARQLAVPIGRMPPGPHTIALSLIADEAGAGRTRWITASLPIGEESIEADVEAPQQTRADASTSIVVQPGEPVIVGPFDAPRIPLIATLVVVAAIVAALWAIKRRRRVPSPSSRSPTKQGIAGAVIGAMLSLLLLFVCMPSCLETLRARTIFVATTCTIVDRGSSGFAPGINYIPMAIVRYDVAGRTQLSSGFDVRGTMYGSSDPDASRLFAIDGQYPCWYDPIEPRRVILRQGPSAVAWFAIVPAAILALCLSVLMGLATRHVPRRVALPRS